jgi:hypothetical protein
MPDETADGDVGCEPRCRMGKRLRAAETEHGYEHPIGTEVDGANARRKCRTHIHIRNAGCGAGCGGHPSAGLIPFVEMILNDLMPSDGEAKRQKADVAEVLGHTVGSAERCCRSVITLSRRLRVGFNFL